MNSKTSPRFIPLVLATLLILIVLAGSQSGLDEGDFSEPLKLNDWIHP